jgi:hypothetical protein
MKKDQSYFDEKMEKNSVIILKPFTTHKFGSVFLLLFILDLYYYKVKLVK